MRTKQAKANRVSHGQGSLSTRRAAGGILRQVAQVNAPNGDSWSRCSFLIARSRSASVTPAENGIAMRKCLRTWCTPTLESSAADRSWRGLGEESRLAASSCALLAVTSLSRMRPLEGALGRDLETPHSLDDGGLPRCDSESHKVSSHVRDSDERSSHAFVLPNRPAPKQHNETCP